MREGGGERSRGRERSERSGASERVSDASERANGRANGPALTSLFLFVPDHSASSSSSSSSSLPPVVSHPLFPAAEDALPREWFQVHPVKLFLDYLSIKLGLIWKRKDKLSFPKRVPCSFLRALGKTDVSTRVAKPTRRILPIKISKELSEKWVRACKKKGTKHHGTMTTVSNIALARAAARIQKARGGEKNIFNDKRTH